MSKRLSALITVLVALALLTTSAFATSAFAASAGKFVSLVRMVYQRGGITLLFETSGLTKADLKNTSFYANSNEQNMTCNFVDHTTTVRCTVSKSLAGMSFHATLAGFSFWGELPKGSSPSITCDDGEIPWYTINLYQDGVLVDSGDMPAYIWKELVAAGFLNELASQGITARIAATFCEADITEPV